MDWKEIAYALAFLLLICLGAIISLCIYTYQVNRAYDKLENERHIEKLLRK